MRRGRWSTTRRASTRGTWRCGRMTRSTCCRRSKTVFTPGKALLVLHRPEALWGVAICKDMDFMNPARRNGRAGVGLMLVPGWDFNVDGFWHGHIAVMRGVEDGFSVVRAAKDGFLTVTDDRGRVVAETGERRGADGDVAGGGAGGARGDAVFAVGGLVRVGVRWRCWRGCWCGGGVRARKTATPERRGGAQRNARVRRPAQWYRSTDAVCIGVRRESGEPAGRFLRR